MWFAKNSRYFAGYTSSLRMGRRRNNVVASPLTTLKHIIYYTSYDELTMIGTRKIDVGDELFMWYGSKYVFK